MRHMPIRPFGRQDRIREHLAKSHIAMGPGAASPRVLRLALARYNIDQIGVLAASILSHAAASGCPMGRAPEKIDDWISTGRSPSRRVTSGKLSSIDRRFIILSLSGKGATYAVRKQERRRAYRSAGNARVAEEFAAILLSYATHPNVKEGIGQSESPSLNTSSVFSEPPHPHPTPPQTLRGYMRD